jgi:uncharacterized protein YndB with AHSA1/START domain
MSPPITVERRISASPSVVYAYLTDSELWARWQGIGAAIEAAPGGIFSMAMGNGMRARGQFVELVEDSRVVFTWGWIDHPAVPPGSSTVQIDLVAEGTGTIVKLTHTGLPEAEVPIHVAGWDHYLPRLAIVAEGKNPDPDPS